MHSNTRSTSGNVISGFAVFWRSLPLLFALRSAFGFVPYSPASIARYHDLPPVNQFLSNGPHRQGILRQNHGPLASSKPIKMGILTAQALMDERQKDIVKEKIISSFPLVPSGVVDSGLDIISDVFTSVAPKQLKRALKPGGMEKFRPELSDQIVDLMLQTSAVKQIPALSDKDKKKLIEGVVDYALDFILKDLEDVLKAPEVKLDDLEQQRQVIIRTMGFRRLTFYRMRRNPGKVLLALASVVALGFGIYKEGVVPSAIRQIKLYL